MSVCLSACSHVSKTTRSNFTQFSLGYMLPVAMARSSSYGNVIDYVLPVLWMTSCIHVIERGRISDDAYVSSSSPGGCTEVISK